MGKVLVVYCSMSGNTKAAASTDACQPRDTHRDPVASLPIDGSTPPRCG
jgi:hypothetical protein